MTLILGEQSHAAPHYDICILGAGIAGIIAALELAKVRPDFRICLIESGSEAVDPEHQAYCAGENRSPHLNEQEDPKYSRARALGGTSHYWGGQLAPLEADTFDHHEDRPTSGWPISRADLDPFYQAAAAYFAIDPFFDVAHWLDDEHYTATFEGHGLTQKIWQYRQLNFATTYRDPLDRSAQIDVYLQTTCLGVNLSESARVTSARCVRGTDRISIRADTFVLAMGGLENARFLLNVRAENPAFLPHTHQNTGRYFSVHPSFIWGKTLLTGALIESKLYNGKSSKPLSGSGLMAFLKVPPDIRLQHDWLDAYFELAAPVAANESLAIDPGILHGISARNYTLMNMAVMTNEMEARFDNHVGLGNSLDAFGQRQLYIDLRLSARELRSSREQILYFGRQLGANGLGRVWLDEDFLDHIRHGEISCWGGHHHMCTTRMSRSPEDGVVNSDCRAHDHENLFVLGSSTFSTSGSANPTFTIGALAVRLAAHLSASPRDARPGTIARASDTATSTGV